ncbi:MAG: PAS domain S-box protein [Thiobacillus sp.]
MRNQSNSDPAHDLAGLGPDVFRRLADTSADGIGMARLDSRIVYANATLRRLLELPATSELGDHFFFDYYLPSEVARLRDEIMPQVQAAGTWVGELELVSPSGAIWQTIQNIFLIRDEHGAPVAFANIITDLTERARVTESLRFSQAVLDSSINAIAIASLEGKLTYVNQAFADLWRLDSVDDALGRSPLEFWEQPQQAEDVVAALQQVGHWQGEMQALRHDGSIATMQLSAHLVRNEAGQPVCMMSSFVDVSARVYAERELLRSEALLNSVIQQIPAMVFLKRASDLRFELLNRAGEQLLGLEQAVLLGKSDHDFFLPEQAATFIARDQEVLASGLPLDIPEESIRGRNGETRILHTRKIGIYDAAGEPTHLLGISLDITEQKQAQEMMAFLARTSSASDPDVFFRSCVRKLAESYGARYAFIGLLLDSGQDVQTLVVWAGEDFAPNFEYNLGGTPCRDVLDLREELIPHDAAQLYPDDAMLAQMGVDSYYGTPLISSSGQLMGLISVMDTQAMAPTRWTAPLLGVFASRVAVELERKAAADTLRELNASLEQRVGQRTAELEAQNIRNASIIHAAMDGFFIADLQGRMLDVNDIYCGMLGYDRAEFLALTIPGIEANESPEDVAAHIETLLKNGQDRFDTRHRRKDGSLLDVEVNVTLVEVGDEQRFYAFVHDIAPRKQAESALIESRDQAERASLAKTEFLSRMSHELRTPMNAILGFAQLLETEPLQEDQAENVREILHAGNHLLEMINEVLDLARVEAGHLDIDIQTVACQPITESCIATIRPLAAQRGITVVADLAGGCAVAADPLRLRQVLLNLLSNAVKYNREGGTVEVSCRITAGGQVRISLQDNGIGIAAEALPRLFQPFERLETTYSGIEGAGIGLALCKRLVEAMQGTIGAQSTYGAGSTFWIEMPQAGTQPAMAGETDVSSR